MALRTVNDCDGYAIDTVTGSTTIGAVISGAGNVIVLVLFAFAFDLSSLATFLGLLSAGLAIGFHDVFLSIGGYLVIVRRFHVRIGDRVQIAGVSGEVANLGLFQLELSEIDVPNEKRTGRVVFISNSYVFGSRATPLLGSSMLRRRHIPESAQVCCRNMTSGSRIIALE